MSDSNNPNDVMRQDATILARENEELRRKLADLQANVTEGGFKGELPRYLLNEPVFIDDTFFEKGSTIETLEVPNLAMVPLNEPAHRRTKALIEYLEEGARRKALLAGRQFTGLVTDNGLLLNEAMREARDAANAPVPVIQVPTPINDVPAMPHTDAAIAIARRRGRPPKVVSSTPPAPQKPPSNTDLGAPMLAPTNIGPAVVGRMAG